jgi:hypothetical protein
MRSGLVGVGAIVAVGAVALVAVATTVAGSKAPEYAVSGERAYDTVYVGNTLVGPAAEDAAGNTTRPFSRLCSGSLGTQADGFSLPIYFAGEDDDGLSPRSSPINPDGGQAVAVYNNEAHVLPKLGKFAFENILPQRRTDGPTGKTVLLLQASGGSRSFRRRVGSWQVPTGSSSSIRPAVTAAQSVPAFGSRVGSSTRARSSARIPGCSMSRHMRRQSHRTSPRRARTGSCSFSGRQGANSRNAPRETSGVPRMRGAATSKGSRFERAAAGAVRSGRSRAPRVGAAVVSPSVELRTPCTRSRWRAQTRSRHPLAAA